MRRLTGWLMFAMSAVLAIGLAAASVLAQQTMDFRPLPDDSMAQLEGHTPPVSVHIRGHGHGSRSGLEVDVDTGGVRVNLPGAAPAPPAMPSVPAPPAIPTRETTGEIVRFGGDIVVPPGQVVEGDVVSMGGSVRVDGGVRGSVTSLGGDVTLGPAARVDGDVVCLGGTLREEPGSSVGGQKVTAPRVPGARWLVPMLSVFGTGVRVMKHVFAMLLLLGIAFVIVKLAPARTQGAIDTIRENPGGTFLVGLLLWGLVLPSLVLLVLLVALLMITIIGIPVGLAALVGYAVLLALALVWGSVTGYALLGEQLQLRLRGERVDLVRAALWGVVALYGLRIAGDLLHIVPVFGILGGFLGVIAIIVGVVLGTLGAGALVHNEYRRRTVQDWWVRMRPARAGAPAREDFPPPPPPEAPGPPAAPPAPDEPPPPEPPHVMG